MIGLLDCNNFYVSCERVFNPSLVGKPVIVLSSTGRCVIARSNEAKALGIKMGEPAFQIEELINRYKITAYLSNLTLYGDMSSRVMSIVSELAPQVDIYSIDECFIDLSGIQDLKTVGTNIVNRVVHGTGVPVSLGVAATKTLAKIASKFAKKYPAYNSVCIIDTEEKRVRALQLTPINDIWGIGSRHTKRLEERGIRTAYDFTLMPGSWVRKYMTVTGERTWKELRGISCIDLETAPPPKKQICTSRSFGKMLEDIHSISEAVSNYASSCAKKLRRQKGYAVSLMVFIHTNNFRQDLPQYWRNTVIQLPVATNDTAEIVHYALEGLKNMFLQGYQYKKAGVIITEITSEVQTTWFDTVDRQKREKLMQAIDKINGDYTQKVKLAIQGFGKNTQIEQEQQSQRYTTDLNEVITINCQ